MASLNGTTPAATYPSLIKFDNNSAISAALRLLSDGSGNATPIFLSATQMNVGGAGTINARLGIAGSGSTSATRSLQLENNTGSYKLYYRDDGILVFDYTTFNQEINLSGFRGRALLSGAGYGSSKVDVQNVMDIYSNDGTLGVRINDAYTGIADATAIGKTSAPAASAMLDMVSTAKGLLPPRMTTAQKNAIASPEAGLIVYDTTLNKLCLFTTTWETITSV